MKVSLITGTYNSGKTLQDTIDSVAKQDYKNIEYIIIDGGSTDTTLEIISNNSQVVSRWISEPDKGIYDAMNKGIKMATGDIVGIINSDDFYPESNVISEVVQSIMANNCEAVYGDLIYVDPNMPSKIVRMWKTEPYVSDGFLEGWHPPHPTFFVKRSLYEQYGLFDENLNISADFELMFRFIQRFKVKACYIEKTLVHMRTGGESNKSIKNIIEGNKNIKKAFKKNGFLYPRGYFLNRMIKKLFQFIK